MMPESATSSRLPARYEPAGAAAIDPLDEPLPPAPPRISSSAPLPPDDPFADADVGPASPRSGPSADPVGAGPRGSRSARSDDDLPYVAPSFVAAAPPERRRRRQHWAGAILIVLGLLILGNNLGLLWWVEPEYILPLILVGAGAWLLFGRGRRG